MRIKQGFVVREIAGEYILIPVGETALQIRGMISLSESGYLIYQKLQEDCEKADLIQAVLNEYEVERPVAEADVEDFLDQLRRLDLLIEGSYHGKE